jgi:hypothetical protein
MVMADANGTHHVVPLAGDGPPDLAVVEALLDLTGLRGELTGQAGPEPYSGR